jgi:hypothetical protein
MGRYNKLRKSYRNKLEERALVSSGLGLGKLADLVNMVMHFEWRILLLVVEILVPQQRFSSIEFVSCYDWLQEHEYHFAVGIQ